MDWGDPDNLWRAFLAAALERHREWLYRVGRAKGATDDEIGDALQRILVRELTREQKFRLGVWLENELKAQKPRRRIEPSDDIDLVAPLVDPTAEMSVQEQMQLLGEMARSMPPRLGLVLRLSIPPYNFSAALVSHLVGRKQSGVPVTKCQARKLLEELRNKVPGDGGSLSPPRTAWAPRVSMVLIRMMSLSPSMGDTPARSAVEQSLYWRTPLEIAGGAESRSERVETLLDTVAEEVKLHYKGTGEAK